MENSDASLAQWLASVQFALSPESIWTSQCKFLSLLLEAMNDGLIVENQHGNIVYVNRRLCEMTGYPAGELTGMKSARLIDPLDLATYLQKTASRKNVQSEIYELRFQTKQENRFFVTVSVQALFDAQNQYMGNIAVLTDITDMKKKQEHLEESEKLSRLLIDANMVGIFLCDLKGIILDVNENMAMRFHKTRDQLLGTCAWDLFSKEVMARRMAMGLEALKTRKSVHFIDERDGNWMSSVVVPIFDAQGAIEKVAIFSHDITQQKKTELQLKESEEKYRAMVESAREAITVLDYEGRYHFMNQIGADRLGTTPQDVVGTKMSRYFPRKIANLQIQLLRKCLDTGIGLTVETETFIHDRPCCYETTIEPIRNADGNADKALVIARDVSDRKKMIHKLQISEEKYRSLVENADDAIFIYDSKCRLLFINDVGARALGAVQADLVGKKPQELFPPKKADEMTRLLRQTVRSSSPVKAFLQVPQKGQMRWKILTLTPLLNPAGEVYAIQGISKDIEEIKAMEEKLSVYHRKMAVAQRLAQVGVVGSSLAHELNQPLTVIRLYIDDMLEELKKRDTLEFQARFQTLVKEINRASGIIQRYRRLSRPPVHKDSRPWDFFAVLDLLRKALHTMAHAAGMEILLDDTLRRIPSYHYAGDLEQIFFILMQNAIQAAERKKENTLRISASCRKELLIVRFEDNCRGIPKKQLEKIFEPFYSTKSREQGTGLGLTIVRQILEEHGGKIQVQSQVRKGTVFSLWLPNPPRRCIGRKRKAAKK